MAMNSPTKADRFLGAVVLESALQRGVPKQELIDLAVKFERLDVVKSLLDGSQHAAASPVPEEQP